MNIIDKVPEEALFLIRKLNQSGETRLVGGFVRDAVYSTYFSSTLNHNDLGTPISEIEIDLATELHYSFVVDILNGDGIKTIPTGIRHGTVTAILNNRSFEITTLRKDVVCDGRHAEVIFSKDWYEDSSRRDFTVNAFYMDISGAVIDYHNGLQDLKDGKIRFIGDAEKRICEDYLRILRYFRFVARFGFNNIDYTTVLTIRNLSKHLSMISKERIKQEMFKLLKMRHHKSAIVLMYYHDVLKNIYMQFTSFDIDKYLCCLNSDLEIVNLAVLLCCTEIDLNFLISNWKLSKKEESELKFLCNPKLFERQISDTAFIYTYGLHKYYLYSNFMYCVTRKRQYLDLYEEYKDFQTPKFPVNGEDLLNLGLMGENIKLVLKGSEKQWVDSNFSMSKEDCLNWIKAFIRTSGIVNK